MDDSFLYVMRIILFVGAALCITALPAVVIWAVGRGICDWLRSIYLAVDRKSHTTVDNQMAFGVLDWHFQQNGDSEGQMLMDAVAKRLLAKKRGRPPKGVVKKVEFEAEVTEDV